MVNDPIWLPSLLLQLFASAIDRLPLKNARFEATKVRMKRFSPSMTMGGVLLEPDASLPGACLAVLSQKTMSCPHLRERGQDAETVQGNCCAKKGSSSGPCIKMVDPEVSPRTLVDIAGQSSLEVYFQHYQHALCQAQKESLQSKMHSPHQACQNLRQSQC